MRAFWKWSVAATCAVFVVAAAVAVSAHHSSAGIDRTKSVTLNGTVKEFRWANPHCWIDLDAPNDKGAIDTWSIEMTSPTFLLRAGWKASTIRRQGERDRPADARRHARRPGRLDHAA
jgi:hypothetical protein